MKIFSLALIVIVLTNIVAFADVNFDPSVYSEDELVEIQSIISSYLTGSSEEKDIEGENNADTVLYDKNGIFIAFRGIDHHSKSSWVINLFIDNSSGDDIRVCVRDRRANRFNIPSTNYDANVPNGSAYLAAPNYDYVISIDDLKAYGITTLEKLEFTLEINRLTPENSVWGETIESVPITLDLYETIE